MMKKELHILESKMKNRTQMVMWKLILINRKKKTLKTEKLNNWLNNILKILMMSLLSIYKKKSSLDIHWSKRMKKMIIQMAREEDFKVQTLILLLFFKINFKHSLKIWVLKFHQSIFITNGGCGFTISWILILLGVYFGDYGSLVIEVEIGDF